MPKPIWVALGGALGATLRYLVGGWVQRAAWVEGLRGGLALLPWGTLVVNVSGCAAIGLLAGLLEERSIASPELRLFLLVGVLGGYTTFSSFGLETHRLLAEGSLALALVNVVASVVAALGAVVAGAALARVI